jgi:hydrogenase maturation factor
MTASCDHAGCITCGDEAVAMRVLKVDETRQLALCADGQDRKETVEIALVAPVGPGDELLVHAGTAIA